NGTFAVLFFDQKTSELAAVTYLDQTTLLKLSPYQLTEGELPLFQESQTVNQETAALEKETLAFVIIQKMRDQKELESFGMA
ncbi:CAP-associated domain-containing protein, partial [Escherichia coli]